MKDKEIKQLARADLVEIIYQLQLENEALTKENEQMKAELESRKARVAEAGTLAEAAMSLSGIFKSAQDAADIYLKNVSDMHDLELKKLEEVNRLVTETKQKAKEYLENIKRNS